MLNVCPVGRSCTHEERKEFFELDQVAQTHARKCVVKGCKIIFFILLFGSFNTPKPQKHLWKQTSKTSKCKQMKLVSFFLIYGIFEYQRKVDRGKNDWSSSTTKLHYGFSFCHLVRWCHKWNKNVEIFNNWFDFFPPPYRKRRSERSLCPY